MGAQAEDSAAVLLGAVLMDAAAPSEPWQHVPTAARRAEDVGLDSLWVGDHLLLAEAPLLDAPMTLAAVAGATTRIDLGTAVFLPSLRAPAWAARQVATLCHLTSPRTVHLGVGLGAGPEEEYRAAALPRAGRAQRTDAFLRALPQLLAGEVTAVTAGLEGEHEDVRLLPAVPAPTIWVGGSSVAALRRAATYADGWLAAFRTPRELASCRELLASLAEQAGRDRPRTGLVAHAVLRRGRPGEAPRLATEVLMSSYGLPRELAQELAIGGSPAEVAEQLGAYVAAGVTQIVIISDVGPWEETCDSLAEVRALLND